MSDVTDIQRGLVRWARGEPRSRLVVLFGSEASGRTWPGSDVDVAVWFDPLPPPLERVRIIGRVQDRCGARRADVVFLGLDTDPVLRFEIFKRGELLYEADPGLFDEERVRAVMLYQDASPFRRALVERMKAHT